MSMINLWPLWSAKKQSPYLKTSALSSMTDDLPIEKQLRLEKIRRGLKDLSRQELEDMCMQTTEALVKLTTKVNDFCKANGLL
jgi:hypothetical protein